MYVWQRESPLVSSCSGSRLRLPLSPDLFEESCLDTGCCFFFTSINFAESDHLRMLVLRLYLHGGKHLEKLVAVERRFGFGGLNPKWQGSVGM